MKLGLLENIKEHGYWRINFQPNVINSIESLTECKEIIEKCAISLRGWNSPHIPIYNDANQGLQPSGEYFEAWTDLGAHKEFWRMYKSSQFIFYKAFLEDWFGIDGWYASYAEKIQPDAWLGTMSALYQITEIFEFLRRLIEKGIYKEGVTVNITLFNTENRLLWLESGNRVPFLIPKKTGAKEIVLSKLLTRDEILSDSREIAQRFIVQVYDNFGWNPAPEQIIVEQDMLLSGRI